MGLLETAAATLLGGERRIDTAARNVTNVNTPGYKREIAFTEVLGRSNVQAGPVAVVPQITTMRQMAQSALVETGNPLDIAVDGAGFVLLRSGERFVLVRGGQFSVGPAGAVVDPLGRIVQQAAGGDLVVGAGAIRILADGTVLEDNTPVGAIGLYRARSSQPGEMMARAAALALPEAADSEVRQGMIERSNVTLSDEMVELMKAQRQVESGAQLVRAYDRLMNQAVSTFSRSG